jgi:hypothetical protein
VRCSIVRDLDFVGKPVKHNTTETVIFFLQKKKRRRAIVAASFRPNSPALGVSKYPINRLLELFTTPRAEMIGFLYPVLALALVIWTDVGTAVEQSEF